MKHFSLGLAVGAAFGMVLSLFKDQNGNRLGKPLSDQFQGTKEDANSLKKAIANLKRAKQNLVAALPQAEKTYTELENEIEYYQMGISRLLKDLQERADSLGKVVPENDEDNENRNTK